MAESPPEGLSDSDLIRTVKRGFGVELVETDPDDAKARNLDRAREELGHIAALKGNPAFNWFFEHCIETEFRSARVDFESSSVKPKHLAKLHAKFNALRKIVRWLDEREIEHRRLDDPSDPAIAALRARINLH